MARSSKRSSRALRLSALRASFDRRLRERAERLSRLRDESSEMKGWSERHIPMDLYSQERIETHAAVRQTAGRIDNRFSIQSILLAIRKLSYLPNLTGL
jgi:hypothetical protein